VSRGGPVGSGPLAGKVGDGETDPGDATPVRAERITAWRCSLNVEALQLVLMAPKVPTIPEGEGEGEARFNQNLKLRGGEAYQRGENWW
jgi:hypothetical protein